MDKLRGLNKEVKRKDIDVKVEEIKEKKKQKVSISYTLKSNKANIIKFEENKIATKEEVEVLKKIHEDMYKRWIGDKFGF